LARHLKALNKDGAETLDEIARFHYEADWGANAYVARVYRRLAHYSGVIEMRDAEAHSHEFYSFLGSLDTTQLSVLRSGTPIPFSQLSAAQRLVGDRFAMRGYYDKPAGLPDYLAFPQESMPAGPHGSLVFAYEPQIVETIWRYEEKPNQFFAERPFTMEQYARSMARVSKLNKRDLRPDYFRNKFTIGEQRQDIYSLYVTRELKASESFRVDKPERGPPTNYADLPQPLRDSIERFFQEEMKLPDG
jgi:hypothetical protein